jgi:hypothetical protein
MTRVIPSILIGKKKRGHSFFYGHFGGVRLANGNLLQSKNTRDTVAWFKLIIVSHRSAYSFFDGQRDNAWSTSAPPVADKIDQLVFLTHTIINE